MARWHFSLSKNDFDADHRDKIKLQAAGALSSLIASKESHVSRKGESPVPALEFLSADQPDIRFTTSTTTPSNAIDIRAIARVVTESHTKKEGPVPMLRDALRHQTFDAFGKQAGQNSG